MMIHPYSVVVTIYPINSRNFSVILDHGIVSLVQMIIKGVMMCYFDEDRLKRIGMLDLMLQRWNEEMIGLIDWGKKKDDGKEVLTLIRIYFHETRIVL